MRPARPADWIFVLAWVAAVAPALVYLRHLSWPCDVDGFRDIAIAQAIVDGHWLADPLYAGEAAWYSPLVPAAVALTSVLGHIAVPRAYVITGLWLNSLVPLAFFLCARRLLGSTAAVAAAVLYLFLPAHPEMWASGTYGPWVFPGVTAQLPFFLGVLAWARALDTPTPAWLVTAGVLLGVTFLAHGAPAFVLAGIVALTSLATLVKTRDGIPRWMRAKGLLVVAGTSLVLALPFLIPLATRYAFHVINRGPATWTEGAAKPDALFDHARSLAALPHWAAAVAGIWWMRRHVTAAAQLVLFTWPMAILVGYTLAILSITSTTVPALAPAHHYTYMLRSFEATLAGCGIVAAADFVTRGLRSTRRATIATAVALTASVAIATFLYPRYLRRDFFKRAQSFSRGYEGMPERDLYRWIRANVPPGAVFVASEDDALRIVGPANRASVSVDHLFSNPYVEYSDRAHARERLVDALTHGDAAQFDRDRKQFGVTHVLARGDDASAMAAYSGARLITVFHRDEFTVFAVR